MKQIVSLFIAAVLEATFFQAWGIYGVSFNAVLALLVLFGFYGGGWKKLLFPAVFSGIMLDALSAAPFGLITLDLMLAVGLFWFLARFIPRENAAHFILFSVATTAWFYLFLSVPTYLSGSAGAGVLFARLLGEVVYTVFGAFLIYVAVKSRALSWLIS